jgi:hypothetical protein
MRVWGCSIVVTCSEYGDVPLLSHVLSMGTFHCCHMFWVWGCSIVVTCSLLRNSWPKPSGVLEHSWRRNQLLAPHFSGNFLLTASLRRQKIYLVINNIKLCRLHQRILANFSSYSV